MVQLLLLPLLAVFAVWLSLCLLWGLFKAVLWMVGSVFGLAGGLVALLVGVALTGAGALLALLLLPLAGLLLAPLLLPVLLLVACAWLLGRHSALRPRPYR